MGLAIRAYARHRGVTDTAVHKAIRSGRIATLADGTIDPDRADTDWARNTDAPRNGTRQAPPRAKLPDDLAVPVQSPAQPSPIGGATLLQARTANEVVKAQTNKVRLARLKGELVERAQAITQVFKLARAERDAWLNWPARVSAPMAAALGVDAHALHVALEAAVREHLQELGELRPQIDP